MEVFKLCQRYAEVYRMHNPQTDPKNKDSPAMFAISKLVEGSKNYILIGIQGGFVREIYEELIKPIEAILEKLVDIQSKFKPSAPFF